MIWFCPVGTTYDLDYDCWSRNKGNLAHPLRGLSQPGELSARSVTRASLPGGRVPEDRTEYAGVTLSFGRGTGLP